MGEGQLNGTALGLLRDVARGRRSTSCSARRDVRVRAVRDPGLEQRIWPGAEVELEAEGIGLLRNRLGR